MVITPKRLQEIADPLEGLFRQYEFKMDGEPLVDESTRMAEFAREDGLRVDYELTVEEDIVKGPYSSDSDINLDVKLYPTGDSSPLSLYSGSCSSNAPATILVQNIVEWYIRPKLEEHL